MPNYPPHFPCRPVLHLMPNCSLHFPCRPVLHLMPKCPPHFPCRPVVARLTQQRHIGLWTKWVLATKQYLNLRRHRKISTIADLCSHCRRDRHLTITVSKRAYAMSISSTTKWLPLSEVTAEVTRIDTCMFSESTGVYSATSEGSCQHYVLGTLVVCPSYYLLNFHRGSILGIQRQCLERGCRRPQCMKTQPQCMKTAGLRKSDASCCARMYCVLEMSSHLCCRATQSTQTHTNTHKYTRTHTNTHTPFQ
ncbi:hypothetical protein BKA56DRAFT_367253 [Ilyonectria sp. MPI-CAGE-AT-0026]|nr:hypothetical protein BKA56DRAFT_367253 [Ilyonectria sp. MPI-CAGE-AT-0026]